VDYSEGFLGACLGTEVAIESGLQPRDFNDRRHKLIFNTCQSFNAAGNLPTLELVHKACGVQLSYLAELKNQAIPAVNQAFYAEKIRDKSIERDIKELAREILASSSPGNVLAELLDENAGRYTGLGETSDTRRLGELFASKTTQYEEAYKNVGKEGPGFSFGVPGLDDTLGTITGPKLVIIAGRPGKGKTSLGLQGALHSCERGVPGFFASLEMEHGDLVDRLAAQGIGQDLNRLKTGHVHSKDLANLGHVFEQYFEAPLYIFDEPNQKLGRIKSKAREAKRKYDVKFILIDYVELIDFKMKGRQRREEIGEISRQLKQLARELSIPVVLLAQLGRGADPEWPKYSDLRESGNLEQDADSIILINDLQSRLIVDKNRQGANGIVPVRFHGEKTVFKQHDSYEES
jgi:replicative DNA helicase